DKFVTMVDAWTGFMGAEATGSLAELVERVMKESGLESMYKAQAAASNSEADADRLANLAEMISSAREFEMEYDPAGDPALGATETKVPPLLAMLRGYLESIALVADADASDPAQGA